MPGINDMTIDDLVLFSDPGPLERIERAWTAVKKYSLMVDQTHAQATHAVEKHLEALPPEKILSEDDLNFASLAALELKALSDSNSYLVKSMIVLLLDSFSDQAHKEIYKLVRPHGPPVPERGAFNFICDALQQEAIGDAGSQFDEENFSDHLDPIRNHSCPGIESGECQNAQCSSNSDADVGV